MKKIALTLAIVSTMLFGSTAASAQTTNFTDVSETKHSWAISAINFMNEKGVVTGYSDGTFKPDDKVTKAEFVTMTHKLFDKYRSKEPAESKFIDVPQNHWAYNEIFDIAAKMDFGHFAYWTEEGKKFEPDQELTRIGVVNLLPDIYNQVSDEETYKIISEMKDFKFVESDDFEDERYNDGVDMTNTVFPFIIYYSDDGTINFSDDYSAVIAPKVASLQQHGIMTAYNGEFKATDHVTRAEAVTILHRLYTYLKDNGELAKYSSL